MTNNVFFYHTNYGFSNDYCSNSNKMSSTLEKFFTLEKAVISTRPTSFTGETVLPCFAMSLMSRNVCLLVEATAKKIVTVWQEFWYDGLASECQFWPLKMSPNKAKMKWCPNTDNGMTSEGHCFFTLFIINQSENWIWPCYVLPKSFHWWFNKFSLCSLC